METIINNLVKDKISNDCSTFWFEGGILLSEYIVANVDLNVARKGVELRHSIVQGRSYPLFVDISKVKSINKEAREYLSQPEASMYIKAAALLASSYLSKIAGTFFLSFNRPPIPTKLFTDKVEALKWLERFVD